MESAHATTVDPRIVKALNHPLRMRLLTLLNQRVASPSELADELDQPLGNVSYHVRTLADLGCIELVSTTPRRGAVEHHYRAVVRPILSNAEYGALPESLRRSIADGVLDQVLQDVPRAARAGGFDRPDVHLSRTPLVLDDQAWDELQDDIEKLIHKAFELQAEAAGRLAGADSQPAHLVMMLYEPARGDRQ